jgi:hypothetical protein
MARGVYERDWRVAMLMHTMLLMTTSCLAYIDPLKVTHVLCVCACSCWAIKDSTDSGSDTEDVELFVPDVVTL